MAVRPRYPPPNAVPQAAFVEPAAIVSNPRPSRISAAREQFLEKIRIHAILILSLERGAPHVPREAAALSLGTQLTRQKGEGQVRREVGTGIGAGASSATGFEAGIELSSGRPCRDVLQYVQVRAHGVPRVKPQACPVGLSEAHVNSREAAAAWIGESRGECAGSRRQPF